MSYHVGWRVAATSPEGDRVVEVYQKFPGEDEKVTATKVIKAKDWPDMKLKLDGFCAGFNQTPHMPQTPQKS